MFNHMLTKCFRLHSFFTFSVLLGLVVLNRPAVPGTPCQRRPYHLHGFAQFVFKGERRIDYKHATGRQTGGTAVGIATYGQGEVDPRFLSLVA